MSVMLLRAISAWAAKASVSNSFVESCFMWAITSINDKDILSTTNSLLLQLLFQSNHLHDIIWHYSFCSSN